MNEIIHTWEIYSYNITGHLPEPKPGIRPVSVDTILHDPAAGQGEVGGFNFNFVISTLLSRAFFTSLLYFSHSFSNFLTAPTPLPTM